MSNLDRTAKEAECSMSFIDKIYNFVDEIGEIDGNDISALNKAKRDIKKCKAEIQEKLDSDESFASMIKLTELIFNMSLIGEIEDLESCINEKIEQLEDELSPEDLDITAEMVKNEISQRIYVNKKSDEKQALHLCSIIAKFLNNATPKLQNTDEDLAKLHAASNMLFEFADYIIHKQ